MQRKRVAGFSVPIRAGVAQSAPPSSSSGGTAVPLLLFTVGGLALLAGMAHLKEKLK